MLSIIVLANCNFRYRCSTLPTFLYAVFTPTLFSTLSVKAAGKCTVEGLIDGHDEAQIDIHARHSYQHSFRHSLVFSRCTTVEEEGYARATQAELQEHKTLHHSPSRLKGNWVILLCLLCFERVWTLSALARRALARRARAWVSKVCVSVNTALWKIQRDGKYTSVCVQFICI